MTDNQIKSTDLCERCVDYGKDWSDLAIIEVEVEAGGIIVPTSGCGKVRAAKVKLIR